MPYLYSLKSSLKFTSSLGGTSDKSKFKVLDSVFIDFDGAFSAFMVVFIVNLSTFNGFSG